MSNVPYFGCNELVDVECGFKGILCNKEECTMGVGNNVISFKKMCLFNQSLFFFTVNTIMNFRGVIKCH